MPTIITTENFISKARKIHKNRYDYSKVIYKAAKKRIKLIRIPYWDFYRIDNILSQRVA